jgi:DNA-binding Lrp family transcriptional regulator
MGCALTAQAHNGGVTRASPDAAAHALGRASLAFLLDQVRTGVAGLDTTDALIVLAINQANIAPLTREPLARIRYGTLQAPAPDARRRAVSINAIAGSLQLPFETVRRRVKELMDRGVVVRGDGGLIVPEAFLTAPDYVASVVASHYRLIAFFHEANAAGWVGELPRSAYPPEAEIPMRAAARLIADYVLRASTNLMPLGGGVSGVVVLLGVVCSPEPVTAPGLARRLGMPTETTRRHIIRLAQEGLCRKGEAGYAVDEQDLARPAWAAFLSDNVGHAHRLFAGLAERGVIEAWTRLAPAPAAGGISQARS